MPGATFLVPLLTGFPVSTTLFTSGVGTLLLLAVTAFERRWVEALLPPAVTGAVVALIGLALVGVARDGYAADPLVATVTLLSIGVGVGLGWVGLPEARAPSCTVEAVGLVLVRRTSATSRPWPPSPAATSTASRAARTHPVSTESVPDAALRRWPQEQS